MVRTSCTMRDTHQRPERFLSACIPSSSPFRRLQNATHEPKCRHFPLHRSDFKASIIPHHSTLTATPTSRTPRSHGPGINLGKSPFPRSAHMANDHFSSDVGQGKGGLPFWAACHTRSALLKMEIQSEGYDDGCNVDSQAMLYTVRTTEILHSSGAGFWSGVNGSPPRLGAQLQNRLL